MTANGNTLIEGAPRAAARNACKLCSPLGAALAFKGVRGCLPFLHGSQGCATYIRRYMISHFREPVDIASSSFTEDDAIFGGARNFMAGMENAIAQYRPEMVGVATTCLSETIGENMLGMIRDCKESQAIDGPPIVHVSTPAYTGTHSEGYFDTLLEIAKAFAKRGDAKADPAAVNVLPAIMSCEDLRWLRETCERFGLKPTLLPDYSDALEGSVWGEYHRIAPGGVSTREIERMGDAGATIEIGRCVAERAESAGSWLESNCGPKRHSLSWPLGIRACDRFYAALAEISGAPIPERIEAARGRLADAYIDAHKYLSEKRAVVFGEPDLAVALAAFLSETGVRPILCATGSKQKDWDKIVAGEIEEGSDDVVALKGVDHATIRERALELKPDLVVGSSKGAPLARELGVPHLRIGFPIHDRFGAQRLLSVGYEGTQRLFDQLVNALLEAKQNASSVGHSYL